MRAELAEAQILAWNRLAEPGVWWTAAERLAIAAETRHAASCPLCRDRAAALMPSAIEGEHQRLDSPLAEPAIEAIHRICADPGRLSESWFLRLQQAGLAEEAYAELVAIVAVVKATDTARRASGLPALEFPSPQPGEPSRIRPAGARPGLGWLATLAPEDRTPADPDLYGDHPGPRRRPGANIQRALSLVPPAMIHWWDLLEQMYQSSQQMRDFTREYRAISHAQIECLAARVAAINRCEY
jgi:hypothetical protein